MPEIVSFKNVNEFYKSIKSYLYENFLVNFYLITTIKKVGKGDITPYDSFVITDNDGSKVIGFLIEGCYMLISSQWNNDILSVLSHKVELSKFKRFLFNGSKPLILAFFEFNHTAHHVIKDRIVYECRVLSKSLQLSNGELEMATIFDLDELAEMSYQYSQEEYHGKGREYSHMRNIVEGGISSENFFIWRDNGVIRSICQVIYNDNHAPLIGHLYTPLAYRNKGYASSILYSVTAGLLNAEHLSIGLFSDASVPSSNKVFRKVGYDQVGTYISITKEPFE